MRHTQTLTLDERDIAVRELTVADIRNWLKTLETAPAEFDLVGTALIDGFDLADLALLTDLTPAAIEAFTPSQIRTVFDAARAVNADFFVLRERLAQIGQAALASAPPTPAAT